MLHNYSLVFTLYMTGVHGLHVLIGVGVILWLYFRADRGEFNSQNHSAVENVGLYWHLVDLIWIFLFPLLSCEINQQTIFTSTYDINHHIKIRRNKVMSAR